MNEPTKRRTILRERTLLEGLSVYLSILGRYKYFIAGATALVAAGLVGLMELSVRLPPDRSPLPNLYTATAVLLVNAPDTSGVSALVSSLNAVSPGSAGPSQAGVDYPSLIVKALQSSAILDKLIEEFHVVDKYKIKQSVRSASRRAVVQRTKLTLDRSTETLTIAYVDIDPVYARDMVVRMVSLLQEWFSTIGIGTKQREQNLLQAKLADVQAAMDRLDAQILAFQAKYGALNLTELSTSQSEILAQLRSQVVLKEIELKNYTDVSNIQDPTYLSLKAQRDNLLEIISEIESGTSTDPEVKLPMPSQKDLPKLSLELNRLTSALQIQQRIYETLSQQYEVAKLTVEAQPVFQVLQNAEIPDEKSGPKRSTLVVTGVFTAFLFSIALSYLFYFLKRLMGTIRGSGQRP